MDDDGGSSVPEWVVTYGDMMSLLLTFFIMLVSLSEVVADQKYRAILDSLQRNRGYDSGPSAPPGKSFPLNSMATVLDTLGSHTNDDDGRGGIKQKAAPGSDIRVLRTREGTPIRIGNPITFSAEQVDLDEPARRELEAICKEIAGKPNKIELHAHANIDPLSESCPFPNKSTLTYERGRAVFRELVQMGIAPNRMRITAFGDTAPLKHSEDETSQALPRVEVSMTDAFAVDFVGPESLPE